MNLEAVFSALDRGLADTSDQGLIAEAGGAAITCFDKLCADLHGDFERESAANSPRSRDLLGRNGSILLHQSSAGSLVAQTLSAPDPQTRLFWTPRNALLYVASGKAVCRRYSVPSHVDNGHFLSGYRLHLADEATYEQGTGCYLSSRDVFNIFLPQGGAPTLVMIYFGAPKGVLDWAFTPDGAAETATVTSQVHNDIELTLKNYLAFNYEYNSGSVIVPDEITKAATKLSTHECYLVRWSALNLLWQGGANDDFVLAAMISDDHPEIRTAGASLVGMGQHG